MSTKKDDSKTPEQMAMEEKDLERQAAKAEKNVEQQLKAMRKVNILVPDDPQNPSDNVLPIVFNGVLYTVPRGVPVEVPEAIAEIYNYSYVSTRETNARIEKSTSQELKM